MAHVSANERREQFIEAAIKVIASVGVDGATTRRIADEAGAPLATLHYCFQTKENLLHAVFEHLSSTVRFETSDVDYGGQNLGRVAADLLTEIMQRSVEDADQYRALIDIWLWAERQDGVIATQMYDSFVKMWSEKLALAKSTLPERDLESITRLIAALADGLILQFIGYGDKDQTLRDTATACEMLVGIINKRRRTTSSVN